MSQIKAKNSKPEIIFRKLLFNKGIRNYRLHYNSLPGKPDIVFIKKRVAIFIDGCFWHKCPACFVKPTTRTNFWMKKINGNLKRDNKINKELKKRGWLIIRIWEHDIIKNAEQTLQKIMKILKYGHR